MRAVKVGWVYSDRQGSSVYRAMFPRMALETLGLVDTVAFVEAEKLATVPQDFDSIYSEAEIIVFQKVIGTPFIEMMQRSVSRGAKIVVDIDEMLTELPRQHPYAWYWSRKSIQALLAESLKLASVVSAPTQDLASFLETRFDLKSVKVIPSFIHYASWQQLLKPTRFDSSKLSIGWSGLSSTDEDFEVCLPALKRLLSNYPNLVFRFIGNLPRSVAFTLPSDKIQGTGGVRYDLYPANLSYLALDIAIAPAAPTPFNFCKSENRWIEHALLRTPLVASPTSPYERVITHRMNGFIAPSVDKWEEYLSSLLEDRELRVSVGQKAFEDATNYWVCDSPTSPVIFPWVELIHHLIPPSEVEYHADASNTLV